MDNLLQLIQQTVNLTKMKHEERDPCHEYIEESPLAKAPEQGNDLSMYRRFRCLWCGQKKKELVDGVLLSRPYHYYVDLIQLNIDDNSYPTV
jgi:hypothetical protein